MKILQVLPDSYLKVGGITFHVKSISERLAKNHDVTVYAAADNELGLPRSEVVDGVKVERFKCYSPSNSYFFSWQMPLRIREAKFDIVHGHGYHAFPLHYASIANHGRFVATTHFHGAGHTVLRDCLIRLLKPFGKRTLAKAERIITVSEYERSLVRRYFKIKEDKTVVIPNGVDFTEFSNLRRQNHGFRSILYVGILTPFKGPQYLVEVLPKLPEDVVLEIVGRGPLEPFLRKRADELKILDRVRFYKNLSREELLRKYADAGVFVLLSEYEAYSIVVAEALAAGTPCVVAKTSALSEWVDDQTCFGVDYPVNLKQLAQQINRSLENGANSKALKKWMGTKILDWNDVVDRLESVYDGNCEE